MRIKLSVYWDDGTLIYEEIEIVHRLPKVLGIDPGSGPIYADDGDYSVWGFKVEPVFSSQRGTQG